MNQQTIDILSNLNKQFYDETGSVVWNQKPDYYWEGWYQLTKFIVPKLKEIDKDLRFNNNIAAKNCHLECSERSSGVQRKGNLEIKKNLEKKVTRATENFSLDNSNPKHYKILDLGCGNARFVNFLNSQLDLESIKNTEYLGVDFSINFMERSQNVEQQNYASYKLKQLDILNQLDQLENTRFDLIVMFGLIHHIPSHQARNQFFAHVTKLLNPNGLLIFTTWQYLDTPRLIKRVVDPDSEIGQQVYEKLGVKKTDLEVGDNILDWVKKVFSYRYSHYFDETEIQNYIYANNLKLLHNFVCDGRDSKRNKYYVCRLKN